MQNMSTPRTPPNQPSRSESDNTKLFVTDELSTNSTVKSNVTQRTNKRRCPSGDNNVSDYLADFKTEIREMIQNMFSSQNTRMEKLESYLVEIKTSNSKIEESFTDMERSVNSVSEQLTSLETKIIGLEKERYSMASKIIALEEKMESFDRVLVKTCIELRNVPKRAKETKKMLYDALLELSKQLEINLQISDIRDVSRQPSKKESPNSTLSVEFTNTLTKATFLTAIKHYNKLNPNNKLNSTHLGFLAPKTPTYAAEQLTPYSKRLFYLARNYAKMNQYMYCWTANGRILMKKDPDSQSIVVKNELQIQKMSSQIAAMNL